ncbi:hypothetical protein CL617_04510 [archaeon]|nr:hypothetical protein [archaeon]|tara:strand:+ start:657 stop:1178 length:522 start_codon:yes stop_codon:yes gene_type:complete
MKKVLFSILILTSLFILGCTTETTTTTLQETTTTTEETTTTIEPKMKNIDVLTNKELYFRADDVEISVRNNGQEIVTLTASNGCEDFFKITNQDTGKTVLLYDHEAFCTQAIKELTIEPGKTEVIGNWDQIDFTSKTCTYGECDPGNAALGTYKIQVNGASKIITLMIQQTNL